MNIQQTTPTNRFEETGLEWLLQQKPNGVLSALEDLAIYLNTQLNQQANQQLFGGRGGRGGDQRGRVLRQLSVITSALCKLAWYVINVYFIISIFVQLS